MRILFVTMVPFENNASATIRNKGIVKGLSELGHVVDIMTMKPNETAINYDDSINDINNFEKINLILSNFNYTSHSYQKLEQGLKDRKILYLAMQYPLLSTNGIKEMLPNDSEVLIVSNEQNFLDALEVYSYDQLFIDDFGGYFGHATILGNQIIAENVGEVILDF